MKITGTKNTQEVNKSKKSSKSSKASGVSFDALVEAASKTEGVESTAATEAVSSVGMIDENAKGSSIPTDSEGRGHYMLEQLEDLERDILSGNESIAIERLKKALESKAIDIENISPELRQLVDEIETRAAIEIAKIEQK